MILGRFINPAINVSIVSARNVEKYSPMPNPKSPICLCGVKTGSYSLVGKLRSPGSARESCLSPLRRSLRNMRVHRFF